MRSKVNSRFLSKSKTSQGAAIEAIFSPTKATHTQTATTNNKMRNEEKKKEQKEKTQFTVCLRDHKLGKKEAQSDKNLFHLI